MAKRLPPNRQQPSEPRPRGDSPLPGVQTRPARPGSDPPLQDAFQDAPRRDRRDKTLQDAHRDASKTLQDVSKTPRDAPRLEFWYQHCTQKRPRDFPKAVPKWTTYLMCFLFNFTSIFDRSSKGRLFKNIGISQVTRTFLEIRLFARKSTLRPILDSKNLLKIIEK